MSDKYSQFFIFLLAMPLLFIAMVVYAALLIFAARRLKGVVKVGFTLALYVVFSIVMVAPLFNLIGYDMVGPRGSMSETLLDIIMYAVICLPAVAYFGKYKIKELQRYGYLKQR